MNTDQQTQLVIIGAGAAGLMAAAHAAELGIPALLLERKHRAGSKILMCGNGRCNLTSCLSAEDMLTDFGSPLTEFLHPAITSFTPAQQQEWFRNHDLPLMRTSDGKVFPKSEKAPDVVRCFTNILRNLHAPICYNAPVENITTTKDGFTIATPAFTIQAKRVLICTGGVSYPKTGSVGDGQKLARKLGHKLQPYRPGLVGIEFSGSWHQSHIGQQFKNSRVKIFDGNRQIGATKGLLECERWGLGGGAISNATRLLSRANAKTPGMEITYSQKQPPLIIKNLKTRPLKEAMVTVGGVDLQDIDPATMQSTLIKNLYFAGEVLDIDGPTGGYNLTAAFAAARLAVNAIAKTGSFQKPPPTSKKKAKGNKHYLNNRKSTTGGKYNRNRRLPNRRRR